MCQPPAARTDPSSPSPLSGTAATAACQRRDCAVTESAIQCRPQWGRQHGGRVWATDSSSTIGCSDCEKALEGLRSTGWSTHPQVRAETVAAVRHHTPCGINASSVAAAAVLASPSEYLRTQSPEAASYASTALRCAAQRRRCFVRAHDLVACCTCAVQLHGSISHYSCIALFLQRARTSCAASGRARVAAWARRF